VRFEIPKTLTIDIVVFWDMMLYSLGEVTCHFRRAGCFHRQGRLVVLNFTTLFFSEDLLALKRANIRVRMKRGILLKVNIKFTRPTV